MKFTLDVRSFSVALVTLLAFVSAASTPSQGQTAQQAGSNAAATDELGLNNLQLLGKRIFEDRTLSEPAGVSCSSCHDPRTAFQGNNGSPVRAVAQGSQAGVLGQRKTPSLTYAAFIPTFGFIKQKNKETGKIEIVPAGGHFWDGRADTLQQQAEGPLLGKREMNNPSRSAVANKVRDGAYADLARQVLGNEVFADPETAFTKLLDAVAAFERTPRFNPFCSKFDDFLRGKEALSPQEARGFALFKNSKKGNCIACHDGNEKSHRPQD